MLTKTIIQELVEFFFFVITVEKFIKKKGKDYTSKANLVREVPSLARASAIELDSRNTYRKETHKKAEKDLIYDFNKA